jgi:hypothetical protein
MKRGAFQTALLGVLLLLAPGLSNASTFDIFGPEALPLTAEDFRLMDQADQALTADTALPLDSSRSWSNSTSGDSGTITLLKRFDYMYQGNRLTCRKLAYEFAFASVADQYRYVLNRCQVADGSWKILSLDASDGQRRQGQ